MCPLIVPSGFKQSNSVMTLSALLSRPSLLLCGNRKFLQRKPQNPRQFFHFLELTSPDQPSKVQRQAFSRRANGNRKK